MQQPFDPYREWLDFQDGRQPADYYELFGLPRFEADRAVISHAADVLISRIRAIRPGEYLAQWSQLLDQLSQAKTCLLDQAAKTTYDTGLRSPAGLTPASPSQPAPTVGTPPAGSPQLASPWDMPVQAPVQPMTPLGMTPRQPVEPMPLMGSPVPSPGQPLPPLGQPVPPMGMPVPMGAVPEPPAALPVGGTGFPPAATMGSEMLVPSGPPVGTSAVTRKRSAVPWFAIRLLVLLIALLAVAFVYVIRKGQLPGQELADADAGPNATEELAPEYIPPQPPGPPRPPPSKPADTDPAPPPVPPSPETPKPEEPKPDEEPKPNEEPKPEEPKPEEEPRPDETKPEQPKPEQPKPDIPSDPKKAALVKEAFAAARADMSDRNLSAAKSHLDRAAANVQTPADRTELARLEMLLGHLVEFWRVVGQCVAQLEGGEELVIKDTRIAVVEASRDGLILKASGRLRRYSVMDMPTLLVETLVAKSFGRDPSSQVLFGSFLAVDPKGDRGRARQLWQQGARAGLDVGKLIPELDVPRR